jgi:hypothetical protein
MRVIELFESEVDYDDLVEKIVAECQPYLNAIKQDPNGHRFHRGMRSGSSPVTVYDETRSGRTPKDTLPVFHKLFDEGFNQVFGHKFRSHVYFGYGLVGLTADYGVPHVCFPRGQIKYCWSTHISDLTHDLGISKHSDPGDDLFVSFIRNNDVTHEIASRIWERAEQAVDEDELDGDEYRQMVNEDATERMHAYLERHPELFPEIVKSLEYTNKDLEYPLKQGGQLWRKEVMMWSSNGYYAIQKETYRDIVLPLLKDVL